MDAPTTTSAGAGQHERTVLALACLAQFMVILDVSVVNVALPSIRTDLGYSASGLGWVVNAYAIAFAGCLLLGGRLADVIGQRRAFALGIGLFAAASAVAGLAGSPAVLTAARAAQGLGGAVLAPASLTILMTTFAEGPARHRALGAWTSMAAAGGAAGVVLGGALTDLASWRWIFLVNIPLGAVGLAVARARLADADRGGRARQPLDVLGAVLVTLGLATCAAGILGTAEHPWGSARTAGSLVAGVALLAAFVLVQWRVARAPLLPLRLLRVRALAAALVVMLLVGGTFFGMWFFLSLYLQGVLGGSPLRAGLAFIPMTMAIVAGSIASSRLIARRGARTLLAAGTACAGAGFLLLARIEPDSAYLAELLLPSTVLALGLGLSLTPLATAATEGVAPHEAGIVSGMLNSARQVGGALGLATMSTIAAHRTAAVAAAGGTHVQALTAGYARVFAVSGGVCLVGALIALLALRPVRAMEPAPPQASGA